MGQIRADHQGPFRSLMEEAVTAIMDEIRVVLDTVARFVRTGQAPCYRD